MFAKQIFETFTYFIDSTEYQFGSGEFQRSQHRKINKSYLLEFRLFLSGSHKNGKNIGFVLW